MSSEWKRMKIGDLCDQFGAELQTGPFGSQLHSYDYTETGVPVVPTEAIDNGKINPDVLPKISKEKASELSRHTLRQGDILFARRGAQATGKTAITRRCDEGAICGTGAIRLRIEPAKSIVLPTFLATYLSSKETITWIRHHAIGATMPNLNEGIIRSIPILLPSLQEQKAIAHILGTLDDKIELNRKTNETLEAIAKALFKSWFVDFDPIRAKVEGRPTGLPSEISDLFPDSFEESELGEIPSGWEVKELDEVAHFLNGLALQKFPPEDGAATLPVIKIAQLKKGDSIGTVRCSTAVPSDYVVRDGDVLFSWSGSLAVDIWCGGDGALNQHLFKVTSKTHDKWFFLQWIKHHLPEFQEIAQGKATTMGHIQRHHLSEAKALIPTPSLLAAMDSVFSPLLDRAFGLRKQSKHLAITRDAFLPKLISGEIRIPDAEKMLEEVGV
jgi:type I restriction enzyme S subunit